MNKLIQCYLHIHINKHHLKNVCSHARLSASNTKQVFIYESCLAVHKSLPIYSQTHIFSKFTHTILSTLSSTRGFLFLFGFFFHCIPAIFIPYSTFVTSMDRSDYVSGVVTIYKIFHHTNRFVTILKSVPHHNLAWWRGYDDNRICDSRSPGSLIVSDTCVYMAGLKRSKNLEFNRLWIRLPVLLCGCQECHVTHSRLVCAC